MHANLYVIFVGAGSLDSKHLKPTSQTVLLAAARIHIAVGNKQLRQYSILLYFWYHNSLIRDIITGTILFSWFTAEELLL